MQEKTLVVVDMVNGFINEGPLSDLKIRQIIPATVNLVEHFLDEGAPVIAFRDAHSPDAQEYGFYPVHCLDGTSEAELIEELKPFEERMAVIKKNTTNGFFAPSFQAYLKANPDISDVYVCGCCTDICVLQFALSLKTYTQTIDRALEIHVLEDAVDTFDSPQHKREEMQSTSLAMLKAAGILIEKTQDILAR